MNENVMQSEEIQPISKLKLKAPETLLRSHGESTSSTLPSWLKNENKRLNGSDDQENVRIKDLCRKWNSFCRS